MPNTRIVTFECRYPNGDPWPNGIATFELTNYSFVAGTIYPRAQVSATADVNGDGSAELWVNTEGLVQAHYRFTLPSGESGTFDLPSGETAISLDVLLAAGLVAGRWATTDFADYGEVWRADFFSTLANTTNTTLGDAKIGVKQAGALATGTTLHDFLARFLYVTDHGAVSDVAASAADIGPALAECLSLANEGDTIIIPATGTGEVFRWTSTVTWSKRVNLLVCGNLSVGTAAMIKANVSNVLLSGYGATVTHTPASGAQSSGLLFYRKDTDAGDTAGHYTKWTIAGFHFVNVTVRTTKIFRQNVRIPLIYTLLTSAMAAGATVLQVREVPDGLTTDMYARVLRTDGVVEAQPILSFDATAKTITVTTPFVGTAPVNRRVTAFTKATSSLLQGATVIPVELDDTTDLFPVGEYASVALTATRSHVSEIASRGVNTITLTTGIPIAVASSGALVSGLNDGSSPTGTDLSECQFIDLEFSHVRSNYVIEIGGGRDAKVLRCHFHDIVRWTDANDARYFTQVEPNTVYSTTNPYAGEWDIYWGECIKVTADTKNCIIDGCTFRRWVRDAVDAFASGNVTIQNCLFEDSYWGFALEAKFGPNDVTDPVEFRFLNNTVRRLPNYGILAGTPYSLIDGNTFEDIGDPLDLAAVAGTAIYINGGHGASIGAADEEEEVDAGTNAAYTTNVRCINNRIARVKQSGILLTEVSESNISGNQITEWGSYPIFIGAAALANTFAKNVCKHPTAPATTYIRLAGTVGTPSLHRFRDNMTDAASTEISLDGVEVPSFYTINGHGIQAAGVGNTPTLANWRIGDLVTNTSDGKIYLRLASTWSTALN